MLVSLVQPKDEVGSVTMKLPTIAALISLSAFQCTGYSAPPELKLLDLKVVAVDNHGRPVTDLTANDFQIVDAGKPQKIIFFRRNNTSSEQKQASVAVPASSRTELTADLRTPR